MHVDTQPTPLIKSKHGFELEKDFVKLKMRGDMTSERSYLYEFNIALFDNGEL